MLRAVSIIELFLQKKSGCEVISEAPKPNEEHERNLKEVEDMGPPRSNNRGSLVSNWARSVIGWVPNWESPR